MKYRIEGEQLPVVICDVDAGEALVTEGGSMSWMTPNMKMETSGGGLGKVFGRMLMGENLFLNTPKHQSPGIIVSIAYLQREKIYSHIFLLARHSFRFFSMPALRYADQSTPTHITPPAAESRRTYRASQNFDP